MLGLLLCVQVVDGADLLSERTETEDKKLNKVRCCSPMLHHSQHLQYSQHGGFVLLQLDRH
jgi:hypothetical protein